MTKKTSEHTGINVTIIKNSYLFLFNVFDGKVEPEPRSRPAGVGSDEQVILQLRNVISSAEVTAFEGRVETEMTAFRFPTVPRRPDD